MKGGENCFLLVHVEGLRTRFSAAVFDPFTQKAEKGQRHPQPPTEGTEAPKEQSRARRQASESGRCSPHWGKFLSALTKSQRQAKPWGRRHPEDSHSAVLSASSWPLVPNGLSHTFLPSHSFSLPFSLPAFLSERTPLTRVSGFSCLCPGKLKDPFSFLFLTRIIHSG